MAGVGGWIGNVGCKRERVEKRSGNGTGFGSRFAHIIAENIRRHSHSNSNLNPVKLPIVIGTD